MASYRVGSADFDTDDYEICVEGHMEHLQPQVRKVLLCLLRHEHQVVTKQMLLAEAWDGRAVSDECLTRCISLLRKHLHDRQDKHLIETISRVGYRLHSHTAPATRSAPTGTAGQAIHPVRALSTPRFRGLLVAGVMLVMGLVLLTITV